MDTDDAQVRLTRRGKAAWNDPESDSAAPPVLRTGEDQFGDGVPRSAGRLQMRRMSGHGFIIGAATAAGPRTRLARSPLSCELRTSRGESTAVSAYGTAGFSTLEPGGPGPNALPGSSHVDGRHPQSGRVST